MLIELAVSKCTQDHCVSQTMRSLDWITAIALVIIGIIGLTSKMFTGLPPYGLGIMLGAGAMGLFYLFLTFRKGHCPP